MSITHALALALSIVLAGAQPATSPHADNAADPWSTRGTDAPSAQWFRDAKFGAFIHFGPYSTLGGYYEGKQYDPAEQIIGLGDRHAKIPLDDYKTKVAGAFNPAKFDAAAWVSAIKAAGQKYVIVTTKHHDGFCMFRTATTHFNVVEATPFKRDVIKELADECAKQGLVFCPYYSIGDWTADQVMDKRFTSYDAYMKAQLKELLTNYGDIKLVWFDNWWYVNNQYKNDEAHAKDLYNYIKSVSPNTLVNDRCGAGAKSTDGDYATPENQLAGSKQPRSFEVVMTNTDDDNWGWVKGAKNYRAAGEIVRNLIDSTSKGGNFVLNVGPNADGEFPPEHLALLKEVGRWTKANSEAIYGTVPARDVTIESADGAVAYATESKDSKFVYLHVLSWPANGKPVVARISKCKGVVTSVVDSMVGSVDVVIATEKSEVAVSVKPTTKPDPLATVFRLTVTR